MYVYLYVCLYVCMCVSICVCHPPQLFEMRNVCYISKSPSLYILRRRGTISKSMNPALSPHQCHSCVAEGVITDRSLSPTTAQFRIPARACERKFYFQLCGGFRQVLQNPPPQ